MSEFWLEFTDRRKHNLTQVYDLVDKEIYDGLYHFLGAKRPLKIVYPYVRDSGFSSLSSKSSGCNVVVVVIVEVLVILVVLVEVS